MRQNKWDAELRVRKYTCTSFNGLGSIWEMIQNPCLKLARPNKLFKLVHNKIWMHISGSTDPGKRWKVRPDQSKQWLKY